MRSSAAALLLLAAASAAEEMSTTVKTEIKTETVTLNLEAPTCTADAVCQASILEQIADFTKGLPTKTDEVIVSTKSSKCHHTGLPSAESVDQGNKTVNGSDVSPVNNRTKTVATDSPATAAASPNFKGLQLTFAAVVAVTVAALFSC